jgi:glycerol-3-phosphate O-acyltransferase
MLDRLKGISFDLVRGMLAWITKPKALGIDGLPHAHVVYVLNSRSLTDLVMLDIVTIANALPRRDPLTMGIPERQRFFFLNRPTGERCSATRCRLFKRLLRLNYFRTRVAVSASFPCRCSGAAPDRDVRRFESCCRERTVTSRSVGWW